MGGNGRVVLPRLPHARSKIGLSEDDVAYLFEDLHMGRSIVAPTHVMPTHPRLCRWRKTEPLTWSNVVVFERKEFERHAKECLFGDQDPELVWGEDTADLVRRRQDEERATRMWRL